MTLEDVKKTLKTDVAFVANQVAKNQEHVAKNIGLLMTLISVAESRIVIAIGKRIEAPTLAAFLLLPLALVSSVMNINWGLWPGGPKPMSFGFISIRSRPCWGWDTCVTVGRGCHNGLAYKTQVLPMEALKRGTRVQVLQRTTCNSHRSSVRIII